MDLKALGLPSDLIEDALAAGPDFPALAAAARSRKFGSQVPKDFREKARQARFLQYRGFSKDHIASALGSSGADQPGEVPGVADGPPDDDP